MPSFFLAAMRVALVLAEEGQPCEALPALGDARRAGQRKPFGLGEAEDATGRSLAYGHDRRRRARSREW